MRDPKRDPIREAQLRLAQTLANARAGEDRELGRLVRERGEQLARLLHGLLRLGRLHAPTNRAFDAPVQEFGSVVRELVELLGPVHLVCVSNQVYVNDLRLRFDVDPEHAVALGESLLQHNVGGLSFNGPLTEEKVRQVLALLTAAPRPPLRRTALQEELDRAGLSSIELHPQYRLLEDGDEPSTVAAEVHSSAARVVTEAFANMGSARLPNPLPIRRAVHELIDLAGSGDAARMAWELDQDMQPLTRHTLVVACLSLAIGRGAGLADSTLADLGMAAMYHDVGFCTGRPDDPVAFERHTRAGLEVLLRQRGFHPARVKRLLAALEHHRRFDAEARPSLYARIIHLADDYDILTRDRIGTGPYRSPPDAVALMAAQAQTAYDPLLLQVFVNVVGPYPPGSLLRLGDGRTVVSLSGVRSPETFARPQCRLVRLAGGQRPPRDALIDLAEGGAVARVVRTGGTVG